MKMKEKADAVRHGGGTEVGAQNPAASGGRKRREGTVAHRGRFVAR
jgi:hypothetical protein